MRRDKHRIHSSLPQFTRLGGLKAVLVRTSYTEQGNTYICEELAALSRDKSIEYIITLDTTPAEAATDEAIFRKIAAEFRTSRIDNSGRECSND